MTVCAATDLQSTNFMTRLNLDKESGKKPELDPYVAIDVDELYVERTSTKRKTNEPDWNETFSTDLLRSAEEVGFTLFHDATVPPDDFIANCKLSLAELIEAAGQVKPERRYLINLTSIYIFEAQKILGSFKC